MEKRLLVTSAHAADFCSRTGGVIAKYVSRGWKTLVICLSTGETGESGDFWAANPGASVEDCIARRKKESLAAAGILGAEVLFLDFKDYPLVMDYDRIRRLAKIIRDFRPDLMLTHYPRDPLNYDHAVCSESSIRASRIALLPGLGSGPVEPFSCTPYYFEPSVPYTEFDEFKFNLLVDITDFFDQKMEAARCFSSQKFIETEYTRYAVYRGVQAYKWSLKKNVKYAEAFQQFGIQVTDFLPV